MSYQHFTSSYSDTEYENPQQETRSRQIVDNNAESEDKNSGGLYGTIQAKLVTGQDIRPPVQERETAISNDKLNWANVWCFVSCLLPCLIVIAVISTILGCFNLLVFPTIVSQQSVFNNNTVVLDLYSKGILPDAYCLYWYSAITIGIVKPAYPVTIIYVDGEKACNPLPNNEKRKRFESSFILVDPALAPVNVIIDQYLTRGATLNLNFTLHLTNSRKKPEGNEQITFCILDNRNSYQHYQGNIQDCLNREKYTFPVNNDANFTLEYTFQESKYFFIILLSTTKVEIQHSYELLYQFYDLNDYHPRAEQMCMISEERGWKNCSLDSSGTQGCFLVYAAPAVDTPQFTDMDVTVYHNSHTSAFIASATILSVGVGVVVLLVFICVLCAWKKKKYCFKHRSYT